MSIVAVLPRPWSSTPQVSLPPARRLVSVSCDAATPEPPMAPTRLRPTRAGRLAVTLVCFAVLCFATLTIISRLASSAAPGRVATVRAGQTLSEIADAELPQLPAMDAVARIRIANQLNSTHLEPGQRLLIPGVG